MSETKIAFEDFLEKCKALKSKTSLNQVEQARIIEFSNTGQKPFIVSLKGLIQAFKDIRDNFDKFSNHSNYNEKIWRGLYANYFKDNVIKAMGGVQSLPLFILISKTIHVSNNLPPEDYRDGYLLLSLSNIENTIDYLTSKVSDLDSLISVQLNEARQEQGSYVTDTVGENRIYYGAPGTGKSYAISQVVDESRAVRIVFHADTQFSDFVGCLKPTKIENELTYSFRPGPFVTALIQALKNPSAHFWLVIEEINRAAAPAVFGEIFQLLDRDDQGESTYSVSPSDPDMISYVENELGKKLQSGKISIPKNLSLLATMNSSDQAVMPLDTAFKRRWKFQYIPLDFTHCAIGDFTFVRENSELSKVSWSTFARTINALLSELDIPEDRHLGPYFLSNQELKSEESAKEALVGKLFLYLWDDVLRHGLREDLFDPFIKSYGQLVESYTNGEQIFSEKFLALLESVIGTPAE